MLIEGQCRVKQSCTGKPRLICWFTRALPVVATELIAMLLGRARPRGCMAPREEGACMRAHAGLPGISRASCPCQRAALATSTQCTSSVRLKMLLLNSY
jgi:hypothetical protein